MATTTTYTCPLREEFQYMCVSDILFFMHLWWERAWKYVLTLPAMVLGTVLVLLLIPDVGMRTRTYSQDRHRNAPEVQSTMSDGHSTTGAFGAVDSR